ncbi:GtrA family protein [Candidatus Kaiserbacteria bacterium]|nr:GtrA family protein [Candidatus Kaiserbacteria bacterium]
MYTFFKFACVGALNTTIDLAVLNVLVFSFGTGAHGDLFAPFKAVSFLAAVTNSYLLNKYWVFGEGRSIVPAGPARDKKEPILFLIVSSFGLLINVSISYLVFALGTQVFSASVAANVGALVAVGAVFAWNFFGYRSFVFKKNYV